MEYLLSMSSIPMTQLYVIFKTNSDLDAGLASRNLNWGMFISYSQVGDETVRHHWSLRHFGVVLDQSINWMIGIFKMITSCCRASVTEITWEMWEVLNRFTETWFSLKRKVHCTLSWLFWITELAKKVFHQ